MVRLSTETLNKFKHTLVLARTQLMSRLDGLQKQDPFQDPERSNDNAASDTEASEEANHDRVISLVEELTRQSKDVESALVRIETGAYGLCQNCGNLIEESRLNILPTAIFCLKCEHLKNPNGHPNSL